MDETEKLVTNEGFDWLYGEDADGSVVEDPPAIGAVTEVGARPHDDRVVEAVHELEAVQELEAIQELEAVQYAEPVEEVEAVQYAEPVEEVEAVQYAEPVEEVEAADTFGTFEAPAPSVFDHPEQAPSDFVSFDEAEDQDPFGIDVEPPGEQAGADDFDFGDFGGPAAASPPPPPPPLAVAPAESETTQMAAVEQGVTAQIPALSSRGDIIPEGPRKASLGERFRPAPRIPKAASKPAPKSQSSSASSGRGKKAVAAALALTLSAAGLVWRVEFVRERIFGNGAPSAAQVEAAFTPLKGHAYQEMPAATQQQMKTAAEAMMPDEIEHFDLRLLGNPQRPDGVVGITSVDPDLATPDQWNLQVSDPSMAALGSVKRTRLAGVDAVLVAPPQANGGRMVMFADPDGLYFFVFATNQSAAKNIATQLARANS